MNQLVRISCLTWILFAIGAQSGAADSFPVTILVDASQPGEVLSTFWRFFGADEPNYAYKSNGQRLLRELGELQPDAVYFRAHNLLNSGDGTPGLKWGSTGVYDVGPTGQPVYSWTIVDQIFDAYRNASVRPYLELGFMPKALSTKPEPYQHHWAPGLPYEEIYTGWAYPPKDYGKWADLIREFVRHCVARYGQGEVEKWMWQVWNEPNIGYWRGTQEEFWELHDYAIHAVRGVLPHARVGGPDSAGSGGEFTRRFLEHCLRGTNFATGKTGTPLDFVSFHAKGAPVYTNNHVRMGIAQHLRTVEAGFKLVSSFPELKSTPVIIGESDPEGCAACQGPALAYRNGTMYSSYTAASFARKGELAKRYGINLEGVLTWAFEFEDQPYFAGFRSLASNGIDKPVLNIFRMFSRMSGRQLKTQSDHQTPLNDILRDGIRSAPDVGAIASLGGDHLWVLLWHYHDDDLPGPEAAVQLQLRTAPFSNRRASFREFRVDSNHGNSYALWKSMGSPQNLTQDQYESLSTAGQLTPTGSANVTEMGNGDYLIKTVLPRQGVTLVEINW